MIEQSSKIGSNNKLSNKKPQKYMQIRVKSINFMEELATSIYFYDVTHQIETFQLEK